MFDGSRGPTGAARLVSHFSRQASRVFPPSTGLLYGSCGTFAVLDSPGSLDRTVDAEFVLDLLGRHAEKSCRSLERYAIC